MSRTVLSKRLLYRHMIGAFCMQDRGCFAATMGLQKEMGQEQRHPKKSAGGLYLELPVDSTSRDLPYLGQYKDEPFKKNGRLFFKMQSS